MASTNSKLRPVEVEEESFSPTLPMVEREAFNSACRGLLDTLEASLRTVSVNLVDDVGASLLHWACFRRKVNVVKMLLERGADTGLRTTTDSQTALHWACAGGSLHVVHALWQHGVKNYADPDARGYQALHVAVQNGHYPLVHYLCMRGVEVDALDSERVTPLHWAAIKGHLEIVRYLRSVGADASRQDVRGSTALHWAVTMVNFPVAQYLANEPNLHHLLRIKDAKGNTPRALAPKDKRIFSAMLQHAETSRRLSHTSQKILWFSMPSLIYLVYYLTQILQFSFVMAAAANIAWLITVIYVIRPTFSPPKSADPLMIGIFYSTAGLSYIYWWYYCWGHANDHYGSFVAYGFALWVAVMLVLHVWLVFADPGILRVNRSQDDKEFISEIERGLDPAPICSSCLIRKPVRCKHDAVTNNCVVRFDHYCIWIFNSVGNDNHQVFMVMVVMCALSHFGVMLNYIAYLISTLSSTWTWSDAFSLLAVDYMLTYLIIFNFLNGTWEFVLIFQQTNMIISNLTMNEMLNWPHYPHFWKNGNSADYSNPFDTGHRNNIRSFCLQTRTREYFHLYHLDRTSEV